jgi:hypothetical protein
MLPLKKGEHYKELNPFIRDDMFWGLSGYFHCFVQHRGSAAGLLIAVPCLAFVNYFRNTLERRLQEVTDAIDNIILELNR